MHVLLIGREPLKGLDEAHWKKLGLRYTSVPFDSLVDVIKSPLRPITADALVFLVEIHSDERIVSETFTPEKRDKLSQEIRGLPDYVAMPDGRKWKTIPQRTYSAFESHSRWLAAHVDSQNRILIEGRDVVSNELTSLRPEEIINAIKEDRARLISQFDQLGFIVKYEHGRWRLGPALKPRPELYSDYYFGSADKRDGKTVTIDREIAGIQFEVERFEVLINDPEVTEQQLQDFFEENPHFLSIDHSPLPHIQFSRENGKPIIPDFILKPIVASIRDSRWEVLDLKKPQAKLLVGAQHRRRLSKDVMDAIRQLRDYGDYFYDPRNAQEIETKLGQRLRRPKLGILIGRLKPDCVEDLESEQSHSEVRVITYDEILDQQRILIA